MLGRKYQILKRALEKSKGGGGGNYRDGDDADGGGSSAKRRRKQTQTEGRLAWLEDDQLTRLE